MEFQPQAEEMEQVFLVRRLVEMEVQVEVVGTLALVVRVFLVKVIQEVVLVTLVVEEVDMLEVGVQEAIRMEGQVEMDTKTLLLEQPLHMPLEAEVEDFKN